MRYRVAHIADTHLGYRAYSKTHNGINAREYDIARAFLWCVQDACHQKADLLLVAGDLFHYPNPTVRSIRIAILGLGEYLRLRPEGRIVLVGGNHDTPRSGPTESPLYVVRELLGDRVHVFTHSPGAARIRAGQISVQCAAIPSQRPDSYVAPCSMPAVEPDISCDIRLLAIHGIHESALPFYRSGLNWFVHPSHYESPLWNYVAWGDYHNPTRLSARQWYSGSPEHCSTNPWTEPAKRGYLLVDLDPDDQTAAVSLRVYPHVRRHIQISGGSVERIEGEMSSVDQPETAVLRIALSWSGSVEDGRRQLDQLVRDHRNRFWHIQAVLKREAKPLQSRMAEPETLDVEERWRQYVSERSQQLPDGIGPEEVIARGLEALRSCGAGSVFSTSEGGAYSKR